MTPVIDDATDIADRIFVGDLEPTPEHAKCLATYIRDGQCDQVREDLKFWKDEASNESSRASAAEEKSDELESELEIARKRIRELEEMYEKIHADHDRTIDLMSKIKMRLRDLAGYLE